MFWWRKRTGLVLLLGGALRQVGQAKSTGIGPELVLRRRSVQMTILHQQLHVCGHLQEDNELEQ